MLQRYEKIFYAQNITTFFYIPISLSSYCGSYDSSFFLSASLMASSYPLNAANGANWAARFHIDILG